MFIHMCKTCKQSYSRLKFKKTLFLNDETWLQQHVKKSNICNDEMVE